MTPEREKEIRDYIDGLPNLWTKGYEYLPDLLAEVERLRADLEDKDKEFHDYANHAESVVEQYQTKLAKAVAALEQVKRDHYAPWYNEDAQGRTYKLADQTLKEIRGNE